MKIKIKISENIRNLRKEKGWSQSDLAKKIEAHLTHINNIETGKYMPSLETIIKIARAFDISVDALISGNRSSIEEVKIEDQHFAERIKLLNTLDKREREVLIDVIDAVLTRRKILDLAAHEAKKY